MTRIGIFGGSFNPVHLGHIRLAREAASELNLKKIYFVPSFQNPLKRKEDLLPDSLRVKLLKAAIKGNPDFELSLCEIRRKGPSFTVDTLKFFKKRSKAGDALYFLSGADVLGSMKRWRSIDRIFKLCRFVVMTRPGHPVKKDPGPVLHMPFSALPVSSSQIRSRLVRRQSVRSLVPVGTEVILKKYYQKKKGV